MQMLLGTYMNQDGINFIVQRTNEDRRNERRMAPPYLTDEGMVLFDRRGTGDRRTGIMQSLLDGMDMQPANNSKQ
jgi:hypothetical protein